MPASRCLSFLPDFCRLSVSVAPPLGREPALFDFCEAIANRTRASWFPERLADRIARARAHGMRCVSAALEDELSELAGVTGPSHKKLVAEYLGWDGQGPRTLKAVGAARGVTTERARQLVGRVEGRLSQARSWTPSLNKVLDLCEQLCPRPSEEIAELLQESGLARAKFHPHGLVTAARVLGRAHSLVLERAGGTEWLFTAEQAALVETTVDESRLGDESSPRLKSRGIKE